jgi:hypothetical protein
MWANKMGTPRIKRVPPKIALKKFPLEQSKRKDCLNGKVCLFVGTNARRIANLYDDCEHVTVCADSVMRSLSAYKELVQCFKPSSYVEEVTCCGVGRVGEIEQRDSNPGQLFIFYNFLNGGEWSREALLQTICNLRKRNVRIAFVNTHPLFSMEELKREIDFSAVSVTESGDTLSDVYGKFAEEQGISANDYQNLLHDVPERYGYLVQDMNTVERSLVERFFYC